MRNLPNLRRGVGGVGEEQISPFFIVLKSSYDPHSPRLVRLPISHLKVKDLQRDKKFPGGWGGKSSKRKELQSIPRCGWDVGPAGHRSRVKLYRAKNPTKIPPGGRRPWAFPGGLPLVFVEALRAPPASDYARCTWPQNPSGWNTANFTFTSALRSRYRSGTRDCSPPPPHRKGSGIESHL